MIYTTAQVAEKLRVHISTVNKLVRSGQLPSVSQPKEGKTRTHHRFDSKVVHEFMKTFTPKGHGGSRRKKQEIAPAIPGTGTIRTIHDLKGLVLDLHFKVDALLERKEEATGLAEKVDQLYRLWVNE